MGNNGRILFDRPKPTAGCSASGRRRIRWKEEMSETRRVSFQNKFEKLVHLVGFIIRKFVTMHGHVNVKKDLSYVRFSQLMSFICLLL
jgi:hypothetical protein